MKVLAVGVGGNHVACGAVNGKVLLAKTSIETDSSGLLADLLPVISEQIKELRRKYSNSFAGLGFGFCGLVDSRAGRILATNRKYPDATSIDLVSWADQEFGLPLVLENDARMALLGERHSGAAQNSDDVVMMTLGTGIGTAAMIGGKLLRGKHYQAGCLGGHFTVAIDGRLCSCGSRGCFEAEASTYALPDLCRTWPDFQKSGLKDEIKLDFETLFRWAHAGDAVAIHIRDHCIKIWAACGLSLVHAYDPELLVVGGGVIRSSYPILRAMQRHIDDCGWTPWGRVAVVPAALGNDAALLGAVSLLEVQQ